MGYRGKLPQQRTARELRADGWILADIADKLGVARSSVSLWVRDVPFEAGPARRGRRREPNALQRRKAAEIAALQAEGVVQLGTLNEQAFLAAGTALYAGEGTKREGMVAFANSDPAMVAFFCAWLRHFFDIDEARLRMRVYLHAGLDVDVAQAYWSRLTGIPLDQFGSPYRPQPDPSIRTAKHQYGCGYVRYGCTRTHRAILGLISALLTSPTVPFRGSSIGRAGDC